LTTQDRRVKPQRAFTGRRDALAASLARSRRGRSLSYKLSDSVLFRFSWQAAQRMPLPSFRKALTLMIPSVDEALLPIGKGTSRNINEWIRFCFHHYQRSVAKFRYTQIPTQRPSSSHPRV
jgi:hypothetical protein